MGYTNHPSTGASLVRSASDVPLSIPRRASSQLYALPPLRASSDISAASILHSALDEGELDDANEERCSNLLPSTLSVNMPAAKPRSALAPVSPPMRRIASAPHLDAMLAKAGGPSPVRK